MTDVKVPHHVAGIGRLGTAAAWISAVCCLPYLALKLLWTIDVPVGISDRSVFDESGWAAGNALMAVIQLVGLLLVLALTRPWARRVPAWLLLFPAWVGTGILFQVAVGALLVGLLSPPSQASGSTDFGGIRPWVFVVVYSAFAGQGAALAIAFACHVRARWGWLLGARTSEVLASRTAPPRWWPEHHLAQMAEAAAAMTAVVALVCFYWAVGGSLGLSGAQQQPSAGMQAARLVGAVTAGVGLLALAGRWGRHRRFWLPAALTWLGSGAMVAFDGLLLVVNKSFLAFGTNASEQGWTPTDTLVMVKVLIGLLAAAVGAVAVIAAAKDHQIGSFPEAFSAAGRRLGTPH
ncbi:MAG TPA: hypothetical protein VE441_10320 [Mycobacterium sp.]|jgi:hypothetical protein|nr:hypothetical protein [Mycobacterium sp.]